MLKHSGLVVLLASSAAVSSAQAEISYGMSLSALADDTHGSSYNLTGDLSPNKMLTVSAGAGHSRADPDSGTSANKFSGDALHAGLDFHSERFGARASWSRWQDSNAFASSTATGNLYWQHARLRLEVIGETREFSVDYSFVNPLGRTVNDTAKFSGAGFGGGASWSGTHWSVYARGMSYKYDNKLQRLINISQLPSTTRLPRLQALTESVLTRGAAALDSEVSFGIDRSFARSGLRADIAFTRDAVAGLQSRDYSAGWRYSLTSLLEAELTLGATRTSGVGSVNYAGVSFNYRH